MGSARKLAGGRDEEAVIPEEPTKLGQGKSGGGGDAKKQKVRKPRKNKRKVTKPRKAKQKRQKTESKVAAGEEEERGRSRKTSRQIDSSRRTKRKRVSSNSISRSSGKRRRRSGRGWRVGSKESSLRLSGGRMGGRGED